MVHYVGLDVSMEDTSVCVIDSSGATIWEGKILPIRLRSNRS